jgi:hypothetical protein
MPNTEYLVTVRDDFARLYLPRQSLESLAIGWNLNDYVGNVQKPAIEKI